MADLSDRLHLAKWPLIALAVAAGGLALTGAVNWGIEKYKDIQESQEQAAYDRLVEQVQVKIGINPTTCSQPSNPLVVDILNGSERTVAYTSFFVEAQKPNYSSFLTVTNPQISTDRIIRPHEHWVVCGPVNVIADVALSQLIWSVSGVKLSFENE
ncbi:hypothetical protein FKO01_04195 [Mesorhizobium sp. B2-3-3]|nr:hypothetical protein FKO01_04195 [Mesorhizobium sp. B2-3-3]